MQANEKKHILAITPSFSLLLSLLMKIHPKLNPLKI